VVFLFVSTYLSFPLYVYVCVCMCVCVCVCVYDYDIFSQKIEESEVRLHFETA